MKKESGVAKSLYKKYAFEDHLWNNLDPKRVELLELADRCVKVDGIYYLKQPMSGHWVPFKTMVDAQKEAINKWLGGKLDCGTVIDEDLIDTFFSGTELEQMVIGNKLEVKPVKVGSCPNVQHQMVIPLGPQYVLYKNSSYLNTWKDEMLAADVSKAALGKLVLELIYRSLCDGEKLHDDHDEESNLLLEQVVSNSYTDDNFKFCMNWLAAIYQRPGINLQTNLWFCGDQQGVGKGTLVKIMKTILGGNNVGMLNQTEIEGNWNDHLVGKLLVESNEFDTSGKMNGKAWNKWIKAHCNEEEVSIRQRNTTARVVLNISNYIFTSNEESPMYIDKTDRRNQLIKTTDDKWWKEFAGVIQVHYVSPDPRSIAAGFAWVLEQVKVDSKFIETAFVNELKARILSDSQNAVERWITSSALIVRGKEQLSEDWYKAFKEWSFENAPSDRVIDSATFGKYLSKCTALGVTRRRSNGKNYYRVDEAAVAQAVDREAVTEQVSRITGDKLKTLNHDIPVEAKLPVFSTLEVMRAELRRRAALDSMDFEGYGIDQD